MYLFKAAELNYAISSEPNSMEITFLKFKSQFHCHKRKKRKRFFKRIF